MQIPVDAAIGSLTITKVTEGYMIVSTCRDFEDPRQIDSVVNARTTRAEVETDLAGFLDRADRVSAVMSGKLLVFPRHVAGKPGLPGVDA